MSKRKRIRWNPEEDRRRRMRKMETLSDARRVIAELARNQQYEEAAEVLDQAFCGPILAELNETIDHFFGDVRLRLPEEMPFSRYDWLVRIGRALGKSSRASLVSDCTDRILNALDVTLCVVNNLDGTVTLGGRVSSIFSNQSTGQGVAPQRTLASMIKTWEQEDKAVTVPILVAFAYYLRFSGTNLWVVLRTGRYDNSMVSRRPVLRARTVFNVVPINPSAPHLPATIGRGGKKIEGFYNIEYVVHWERHDTPGEFHEGSYTHDYQRALAEFDRRRAL